MTRIYVEKPASAIISRRTFLKILGIIIAVTALGAYKLTNIVLQRNKYIKMRQKAQYRDDMRVRREFHLAACFQNPMIKKFYDDFAEHPLSEVSEALLHTKYVPRVKVFPGEIPKEVLLK